MEYYPGREPWDKTIKVFAASWGTETPDIGDIEDPVKQELHRKRARAKGGIDDIDEKMAAAKAVYQQIVHPERGINPEESLFLKSVFDNVTAQIGDPGKKCTVHVPIEVKDWNMEETDPRKLDRNALSTLFSLQLAADLDKMAKKAGWGNLDFSAKEKRIIKISRSVISKHYKRGDADVYGRFAGQVRYDADQFEEGDLVIVPDDHIQTGASPKAMIDALKRRGCKVLGVATLSCHPEAKNLWPDDKVRDGLDTALGCCVRIHNPEVDEQQSNKLLRKYKEDLDAALGQLKLSVDNLTNRELLTLMGLFIHNSKQEYVDFFERMKECAGVDPHIIERPGDSLKELIGREAITPARFGINLKEEIEKIMGTKTVEK